MYDVKVFPVKVKLKCIQGMIQDPSLHHMQPTIGKVIFHYYSHLQEQNPRIRPSQMLD